MKKIVCPTCGGNKRDHTKGQWKVHQEMNKAYVEIQRMQRKREKKYAKHGTSKLR